MRIAFWASAVLIALGPISQAVAKGSVPLPSSGTIYYSVSRGKTKLSIQTAQGGWYVLRMERDATVSCLSDPRDLTVVGEIKGTALIIIDTYPSIPGGMSYCQAGAERFLRVISIAKKPAVETYRVKLESCRENIELGSPGVDWRPESSQLSIHWLQGPGKDQRPADLTTRIGADGRLE